MNSKYKVDILIYLGELGKAGEYVINVYETFSYIPNARNNGFHFGNTKKVTRKTDEISGYVANDDIDKLINKFKTKYTNLYGPDTKFNIEIIE